MPENVDLDALNIDQDESVDLDTALQFDDVQSGASRSRAPVRMDFGAGGLPADASLQALIAAGPGVAAIGKGAAQAGYNVGRVGTEVSGIAALYRNATGEELLPAQPEALRVGDTDLERGGEMGGKFAASSALSMLPSGAGTSGFVGGAAETGTPTGALVGALTGKALEGGTAAAVKLADYIRALKAASGTPQGAAVGRKVVDAIPGGKLVRQVRELHKAGKAAQEGAEYVVPGAVEKAHTSALRQEQRTMSTAQRAATVEDRARTRMASEGATEAQSREAAGARRAQERKGASMARDDKAQYQAIVEDSQRSGEAQSAIERARAAGAARDRSGQEALGEAQFREEASHRQAIVQDNALQQAADEAEAAVSAPPKARKAKTTENASGESAASAEALSRQKTMAAKGQKFVVYDKAGNRRELIGPDAVDYAKYVKKGETYGIESKTGFQVLENKGGKVPEGAGFPETDFQKKVKAGRAGKTVLGGETAFDPGADEKLLTAAAPKIGELLKAGGMKEARSALEALNAKLTKQRDLVALIDELKKKVR